MLIVKSKSQCCAAAFASVLPPCSVLLRVADNYGWLPPVDATNHSVMISISSFSFSSPRLRWPPAPGGRGSGAGSRLPSWSAPNTGCPPAAPASSGHSTRRDVRTAAAPNSKPKVASPAEPQGVPDMTYNLVAQNQGLFRSLPLWTGGAGIITLLVNRTGEMTRAN